jgi:hypothetical protein
VGLGVGVKFFRAYPYYLSTLSVPVPGGWRWLIFGLALEGFDIAVLGHLFKLKMSADSALSAIATLWAYSGGWSIVALLHDLGLRPVKRNNIYTQWFGKQAKPKVSIESPTPYPSTGTDIIHQIDYSDYQESAAGKFASTKNDKLWLTNEIEDLVKLGDAAGICIWLVAQTPHCKNGIDGSLLSSLRRIIIASEDNLAQLQNWTNTTFMNGISLDECAKMCQASPVNRSVYNSVTREWYAMPRLRQGESYFDRDSRQMVGNDMN